MPNTLKSALKAKDILGVPLWLKYAYTAFMAVLIPVYWKNYGVNNFLYFCDLALLLTLAGLWLQRPLFFSMSTVGILLPQFLWCADYLVELCGGQLTGMTAYMFDENRSLFLRGLSFFHGWLPFLLLFLVHRTGYHASALWLWAGLAWAACLYCFFLVPGPGQATGALACNVNYVYGMSDTQAQTWMPAPAYLACWMAALFIVYAFTHLLLRRFLPSAKV